MNTINLGVNIDVFCKTNDNSHMFVAGGIDEKTGYFPIYVKYANPSHEKVGQTRFILNGHTNPIVDIVIDRKDKFLYSIDDTGIIYTWLIKQRRIVRVYKAPMYQVMGLIITKKNYLIAYGNSYDVCPCRHCESAKYSGFHPSMFGVDYNDYDFDPESTYFMPDADDVQKYSETFEIYSRHLEENKQKNSIYVFSPHWNQCIYSVKSISYNSSTFRIVKAHNISDNIAHSVLFVLANGAPYILNYLDCTINMLDILVDLNHENNGIGPLRHQEITDSVMSADCSTLFVLDQNGDLFKYRVEPEYIDLLCYYEDQSTRDRLLHASLAFVDNKLYISSSNTNGMIYIHDVGSLLPIRSIGQYLNCDVILHYAKNVGFLCYNSGLGNANVIHLIRTADYHRGFNKWFINAFKNLKPGMDDAADNIIAEYLE